MSDTTPTTSSASAPSGASAGGPCCTARGGTCCTGNASTCPCADRLARVERTVCRIRLWLFVALGVLILLIGIALGRGGAMKEMQERMRGRQDGPRAAAPLPPRMQGPPPAMQGGPGQDPREGRRPRGRGRGSDRDA